jgi:hypothetical protein
MTQIKSPAPETNPLTYRVVVEVAQLLETKQRPYEADIMQRIDALSPRWPPTTPLIPAERSLLAK